MPKLIFFAGSARKDSVNKKLAKAASEKAKELGADVTYIDLADYALPLFCEDYEAEHGIPQAAKDLKKLFADNDGFLVASPEYNSTYSPILKNTLDWMTRPESKDEPMLMAFKGKIAAITAATPGALGGIRGLVPLRLWLSNIGIHVIPNQYALGGAFKAFDGDGNLIDENPFFNDTIKQFVETAKALS